MNSILRADWRALIRDYQGRDPHLDVELFDELMYKDFIEGMATDSIAAGRSGRCYGGRDAKNSKFDTQWGRLRARRPLQRSRANFRLRQGRAWLSSSIG